MGVGKKGDVVGVSIMGVSKKGRKSVLTEKASELLARSVRFLLNCFLGPSGVRGLRAFLLVRTISN